MTIRSVFLLLAVLLVACGGSEDPPQAENGPADPSAEADSHFTGTIVWKATAGGDDPEGVEMFRGLAATEIRAAFGDGRVRFDEVGGINAGAMLLLPGEDDLAWKAVRLDPGERTFERAIWVNDLDAVEDEVKRMMPKMYVTGIESTGETEEICGYATEKCRVTQSGFVSPGAVAHLWIAKDLELPRVRIQADFPVHRMNSPLMLSFPGLPGAVLKAEILENDVLVTWEATEVRPGAPDPEVFEIPEGWSETR